MGKTKLSVCAKLSETQTLGTLPALIPHYGQFPGGRFGANEHGQITLWKGCPKELSIKFGITLHSA